MVRVAVVMAGGAGERFWPLSLARRPKYMLDLTGNGVALLAATVNRVASLIPRERILVVTGADQAGGVRELLADLPPENILVESDRRNTAPCIGLACACALARWGEGPEGANVSLAVFPSDHLIEPLHKFRRAAETALDFAESSGGLVTIGIRPDRPEIGYGYIETGNEAAGGVRTVVRFIEKPDPARAEKFLGAGKYLWNSGIFFWTAKAFLKGLRDHLPGLAESTEEMRVLFSARVDHGERKRRLAEIYGTLDSVSVDYGLMEKAENVYVLPADFHWDDIGSWDALGRIRSPDSAGNVTEGDVIVLDSRNCLVLNDSPPGKIVLAVLGVEDLVVVTGGDAVLVCPRSRSQDVKKIVQSLKDRELLNFI